MARRSLSDQVSGHSRNPGDAGFLRQTGITADIELIPIQKIDEAYERLLRSDVKYRFVIDMASLT